MPTIVKKGLKYQCQIRLVGEKHEHPCFDTEAEAREYGIDKERRLREERNAAKSKFVPQPPGGDLNNEELSVTIELYKLKKDISQYHLDYIPTLLANIKKTKVGELDDGWVEDFIETMRAQSPIGKLTPYAFRTIRGYLDVIVIALAWRARRLKLKQRPFEYDRDMLGVDSHGRRERVLLDAEQRRLHTRLRKLRRKSGRHWRCLVRLALSSGARLGELINSTWSQFDIEARRWLIPEVANKTKSRRLVPLGKRSLRILKTLKADASPNSARVFHRLAAPDPSDSSDHASSRFWVLMKEAAIEDFNLHDLRHMAIVAFVRRAKTAADLVKIMKAVGHKDYSTFDGYITFHDHELFTIFD